MTELSSKDILKLNWKSLKEKYISLELKPTDVIKAYLDQIKNNTNLNAFITICEKEALEAAKVADENYKNGKYRSLEGFPLSIKDLFCTKGILTTAASKMLEDFVPNYESFVTQCILEDGAICLGKTNMDEFAMGAANLYSAYGNVVNPWKHNGEHDCVSGGSSGGSAVSVASFQALGSLGSDTGGSVRQPAAFCGIVGIRPTYGRCSRRGMIAFASSLDQAGVFGRDVYTAASCLESIMKPDSLDYTHSQKETLNLTDVTSDIKGLKVGVIKPDIEVEDYVLKAIDQTKEIFEKAGAQIEEIEIKNMKYCIPVYYTIAPAECASNLARYDGIRYGKSEKGETYHESCINARKHFGDEVRRRILLGNYFLSSEQYDKYFNQACKVRQLICDEIEEKFKEFDVILSPTTPHAAFRIDSKPSIQKLHNEDYFTSFVNLSGACGISVPVSINEDKMPVGVQIVAPAFREDLLVKFGKAIEENANFQGNQV